MPVRYETHLTNGSTEHQRHDQATSTRSPSARSLEHLPLETLQAIICHINSNVLLRLQTLSKRFHSLASAEIYKSLDFNITCSDLDETGDVVSRAADALQTINTSNYNYAQHVRNFRLGYAATTPRSSGLYMDASLQTRAVFDSKSDASKFLNTSILQMVRKASILETFKWDIPVELSGYVYRALQQLPNISHLYVRLDVGPITKFATRTPNGLSYYPPPPPGPPVDINVDHDQPISTGTKAMSQKRKKRHSSTFWADQRAFSGFTTLNTLEVTRLTSLEGLTELRQCIKACSATLRSLTLTIDPRFGAKAQRTNQPVPPTGFDSLSDTELEDEMLFIDPSSHSADATETDRREEKIALEGVLAKVFDLENTAARGQKLERKMGLTGAKCLVEDEKSITIQTLENVVKSLRDEELQGPSTSSADTSRLEKYKMMKELAELYISQHAPRAKKLPKAGKKSTYSTKKPFKQISNYKAQPYGTGPPGADYLMDDLTFEPNSYENEGLSSPMSIDTAVESSIAKQWSAYHSKDTQAGANYLLDPLPPLPSTNGMGSSAHPPVALPTLTTNDLSFGPPQLGPTYSVQQPGPAKSSPFSHQGISDPSYPPYSISYPGNAAKSHGKPAKTKNKPYQPSGTKSPGSAALLDKYSHLYLGGGSSTGKGSPSPFLGGDVNGSTPWKAAPKPAYKPLVTADVDPSSTDSSVSSDTESDKSSNPKTTPLAPFFAAESTERLNEGIDIDMEHPDEDDTEAIEDQGTNSEIDDAEADSPRKRLKPFTPAESSCAGLAHGKSSPPQPGPPPQDAALGQKGNLDKMHDYVRTAHGIQLETFRLQHVPLRASIVGKALDLQALQRITLLETGPQDAFWALLVKLTDSETPIAFKSIHTDHVSFALLKFLSTFTSLEELFLHERRAKNKDVDPGIEVDLSHISQQALRSHVKSLKRLMIRNERNDSWDLDLKTLNMLVIQAKALEELAISVKSQIYHGLLQVLPAFKSLRALHLIALRGCASRGVSLEVESMAYTVDSLIQCADLRLRYIAIAEKVTEISGHAQFRKYLRKMIEGGGGADSPTWTDKKGKGKAVDPVPLAVQLSSEQELDRTFSRMQAAQRKLRISRRFEEVGEIRIFDFDIRIGRL